MNNRTIKFVRETVGILDNIVKGLNINKEAIEYHTSHMDILKKKLDGYDVQYKNEEYMKTLSPPEKQNLINNANRFYQVFQETKQELDYLDMSRYSPFVSHAINALDRCYIQFDYIYRYVVESCGDIILPKFTCIKLKDFWKGTYKQQISNLYIEIEAQVHDISEDYIKGLYNTGINPVSLLFLNAFSLLAEAMIWIEKEQERLQTEALPEIKKIEIPKETVPEIPKRPEDKLN